jgi:palmitoyltransferase
LEFEMNDFEDPNLPWPPPDPDRIPRLPWSSIHREEGPFLVEHFDRADEEIAAFRRRQQDMQRRNHNQTSFSNNHNHYSNVSTDAGLMYRRRKFHGRRSQGEFNNDLTVEPDSSRASFSASESDSDGNYHRHDKGREAGEEEEEEEKEEGEEGWQNAEGERLRDFGVDEEVEFYDEDNIPLATLMEKRKRERREATRMTEME